jgi:O-antigen/teichoic acid export membrane protein
MAGQVVNWLATLVVIRLLAPADYGVMAIAVIFISFFQLFSGLGLTPAVVQARDLDEDLLPDVFGTALVVTVLIMVLLYSGAPLIGSFFDEPAVVAVVQVLSLQFVFTGFTVLPQALLQRDMHFRGWSLAGLGSNVANSATTLALAWLGYGVWALVWGNMVGVGLQALLLNLIVRRLPFPRLQLGKVRHLIRYGGTLSLTRVMNFVSRKADFFIIGKLLGKEALGLYSVAFNLAQMPMSRGFGVMNRIAFPAFSQLQLEPKRAGENYLKAIRLVSLFGVPVAWGMASVAGEAIPLILGSKWTGAIVPFQVLCLVLPLRMVSHLMAPMLQGMGRVDIGFWNVLRTTVTMLLAFPIGAQWGIVGVSLAWATAWPAVFLFNLGRSLPVIELTRRHLLGALLRSWLGGAFMVAAVEAFRGVAGPAMPATATLVLAILLGALAYTAAVLTVNRAGAREVLDLARSGS